MIRVVFVDTRTTVVGGVRTKLARSKYYPFLGHRVTTREDPVDGTGVLKVLVDGKKVAYWRSRLGRWDVIVGRDNGAFRREKLAVCDTMFMDDKPFTLEGRQWPREYVPVKADETAYSAPCIFCGKQVWHTNDDRGRGTAWCLHATLRGRQANFLYCNTKECNNEHVWTCVDCSIDTVDPKCPQCGGTREKKSRELALARGENV